MPGLRFIPLIIIAVIALGTWWLAEQARRGFEPAPPAAPRSPDFIVDGAKMSMLNQQGDAQTLVSAEKMIHVPDTDIATFDNPRVLQTRVNQPSVTIVADSGSSTGSGEIIDLAGNVVVNRAAAAQSQALILYAETLRLRPDEDIATSDKPVRIVQGDSVLTGTGMELNNALGTLAIKNRARMTIAPRDQTKPITPTS